MKISTTTAGLCLDINSKYQRLQFVRKIHFNSKIIKITRNNVEITHIALNRYILGPYGHTDFFDRAMGLLTPWSFVPHHILSYDDEMTYTQRIYNVILSLYDWWFHSWIVSSRQNEIAQRYFSHLVGKSHLLRSKAKYQLK